MNELREIKQLPSKILNLIGSNINEQHFNCNGTVDVRFCAVAFLINLPYNLRLFALIMNVNTVLNYANDAPHLKRFG